MPYSYYRADTLPFPKEGTPEAKLAWSEDFNADHASAERALETVIRFALHTRGHAGYCTCVFSQDEQARLHEGLFNLIQSLPEWSRGGLMELLWASQTDGR